MYVFTTDPSMAEMVSLPPAGCAQSGGRAKAVARLRECEGVGKTEGVPTTFTLWRPTRAISCDGDAGFASVQHQLPPHLLPGIAPHTASPGRDARNFLTLNFFNNSNLVL